MIRTFRNTDLAALWEGKRTRIDRRFHARILARLDTLDAATEPASMNLTGYDFHALLGFSPTRYTVHVDGPRCLTFEFEGGDAYRVDFEQYHWDQDQ